MQVTDWNYVYKKDYDLDLMCETNLVYTPLVSPDRRSFCMQFDHTSPYQTSGVKHVFADRPNYTAEAVRFYFEREIYYRDKFKKYSWAPNYIHDDLVNQRIFFDWSGESCNRWVVENTITDHCPDWEDQIVNIVNDLLDAGCYKTTLYPHCFFVEEGVLKMFDYYGCADIENHIVPFKYIAPILTAESVDRLSDAIAADTINTKIIFKQALEGYSRWNSKKLKELAGEIS